MRAAAEVLYYIANNPVQRLKEAPTLAQADQLLDAYVANIVKTHDANDVLYAVEASQDYNPNPGLESVGVTHYAEVSIMLSPVGRTQNWPAN